jgi:hypothetical protein
VNLDTVCIISSKSKEPSKLLKGDLIPPFLGHSMEFSCVSPLLNIQAGKELSDDLIVPILFESHDIPQVLGSTRTHYLIKDRVMLFLHIGPVNPLGNHHEIGFGNDHGLIEVLLKCRVKPIITAWFLLNKPQIFFSLFPHQICLAPCS